MFAGLAGYVWFGPTAVRQLRRMAAAREQVPAVEAMLRSDDRFSACSVDVTSAGGLVVLGIVRSDEDLRDLESRLNALSVAGPVMLAVRAR